MSELRQSARDWKRIDRYAIQSPCGLYTIACVIVGGQMTFELYRLAKDRSDMSTRIEAYPSSDAAKAAYDQITSLRAVDEPRTSLRRVADARDGAMRDLQASRVDALESHGGNASLAE